MTGLPILSFLDPKGSPVITGFHKGQAWINMTRVRGIDGSDSHSLTRGEITASLQIEDIVKYLVRYVPGFENARHCMTAPFPGIRETRRAVCHYMLNRNDFLARRRDVCCRGHPARRN